MSLLKPSAWITPALVVLLGATCLVAWMDTWVEHMKQPGTGALALLLLKANVVLGACAVLTFALGVEWLARRTWLRAAVGLAALPVLTTVLVLCETWVGNQVWITIFIAPLSGVQPFGQP
jgi:hypothetical protein